MLDILKPLKFAISIIITIILTLGLSISLQSLLAAWTAPSSNPPLNNIVDLNLGGGLSVATNALVLGNLSTIGKVVIGTTTPTSQLHLYKNSNSQNAEMAIQSGNGITIQDKWSIYQDGFGGSLRFWNDNVPDSKNALTVLKNGNMGVGVVLPSSKLEINGGVKIGYQANCGLSNSGTIRYNSVDRYMEFCNGFSWIKLEKKIICPIGYGYNATRDRCESSPICGTGIYDSSTDICNTPISISGSGISQNTNPDGWFGTLHTIEINNTNIRYCNTIWGCGGWTSLNGSGGSGAGQFAIDIANHAIRARFWHGEIGWQYGSWASLINGGSTASWWNINFEVSLSGELSRIRSVSGGSFINLNKTGGASAPSCLDSGIFDGLNDVCWKN